MGVSHGKLGATSKHANVLFVGLEGSGKTAILSKVSGGNVYQKTPTSGFSMVKLSQGGFKVCCFDLGGKTQPIWANYYKKCHLVVFVIDSTDKKRIEKAGTTLQVLLEDPQLSGIPLLILANKQDLFGAVSATEISDGLNCSQIRGRSWQIQETSAQTGEGIQASFEWLARTLAERHLSAKEIKKIKFSMKR